MRQYDAFGGIEPATVSLTWDDEPRRHGREQEGTRFHRDPKR